MFSVYIFLYITTRIQLFWFNFIFHYFFTLFTEYFFFVPTKKANVENWLIIIRGFRHTYFIFEKQEIRFRSDKNLSKYFPLCPFLVRVVRIVRLLLLYLMDISTNVYIILKVFFLYLSFIMFLSYSSFVCIFIFFYINYYYFCFCVSKLFPFIDSRIFFFTDTQFWLSYHHNNINFATIMTIYVFFPHLSFYVKNIF